MNQNRLFLILIYIYKFQEGLAEFDDFGRIDLITWYDTPNISVMELRAKARRLKAEHNIKLVDVDYLQLMEGSERRFESRVQEVSAISRSLKAIARELDIPVLALSQLSRAVESRTPSIPKLADLRESGSIEQDADVVMFLFREDNDVRENVTLEIAKHRNGPIGQIGLRFVPEQVSFFPLERRHEEK